MELRYTPPSECEPGTILRLLEASYAALVEAEPEIWMPECQSWEASDRDAFEHPQTVGACTFLTWAGSELVGFFAFDPRPRPLGLVGHNCILPAFRGRGLGSRQLRELLGRLESIGIRRAQASTLDHPFFLPARRMYVACGFHQTGAIPWERDPARRLLQFEARAGGRWVSGRFRRRRIPL
jgi:GNAT superfamily N-acetyltransferase